MSICRPVGGLTNCPPCSLLTKSHLFSLYNTSRRPAKSDPEVTGTSLYISVYMSVYIYTHTHTENKLHSKHARFKTKVGEALSAFYRWGAEGTGDDMSFRSYSTSVIDLETEPKPPGLTGKQSLLPGMEKGKLIHRNK